MVMARDVGRKTNPSNSESERGEKEKEEQQRTNSTCTTASNSKRGDERAPAARLTTSVRPQRISQTERAGRGQGHRNPRRERQLQLPASRPLFSPRGFYKQRAGQSQSHDSPMCRDTAGEDNVAGNLQEVHLASNVIQPG